jgi:peptidoglycan/xylan/chitin deacetylase (PgdA/CDA1 family)
MRIQTSAALLLLAVSCAMAQAPGGGRQVAITIDDGPAVGGRELADFQKITAGLIANFSAEKVPVTMFVNERQLNVQGERDARAEVLVKWLDAGLDLANHAYSHPSLNRTLLRDFQDDVIRGEVIMRPLLQARGKKLEWFRYPYLHSGETAEIHQGIMNFLEERHYRVAHVTVDYADYSFAGAYSSELKGGRVETAEKIKQAYLDQVDAGFEYAEKASQELYGYEIPQILLIHCNELNSVSLRDSIARMRKRGYSFISLDEATKDPAYQRADSFAGNGGSWLSRTARLIDKKIQAVQPRFPQWITDLPR